MWMSFKAIQKVQMCRKKSCITFLWNVLLYSCIVLRILLYRQLITPPMTLLITNNRRFHFNFCNFSFSFIQVFKRITENVSVTQLVKCDS